VAAPQTQKNVSISP